MKPTTPGTSPARRNLRSLTAPEGLSVWAGDGEADLLDRLALWLADVSAEAARPRTTDGPGELELHGPARVGEPTP